MFRILLLFVSLASHQLCAVGAYSVGDRSQDSNIDLKDLPRYIRLTCQTQAKALEKEVDTFKYGPQKDFILLPHAIETDVIVKIDHIAEDDRNDDFIVTRLRKDLESRVHALKNPDFFTVDKRGRFEFAFKENDPKSLMEFYAKIALNLSMNYVELTNLRTRIHDLPSKDMSDAKLTIFSACFKARAHLDESLALIIHAMRPHILKFKESINEPDIHDALEHSDQILRKISSIEGIFIFQTKRIAQQAFSSPGIEKAWKESQKSPL